MMASVRLIVTETQAGQRLDLVVAEGIPELSRSHAHMLIRDDRVRVDGAPVKPGRRVVAGDLVEVELTLPPAISAQPENIPLSIVYRDQDLAIIDKPAGLVVHPAPGHQGGTLANALAALFPQTREVGAELRPGIVHRLDKDTSGLMVVALSAHAHASLQEQIASRTARRVYLALAAGSVEPPEGIIDAPIGRDPIERKRMAVHGIAPRPARTSYSVLERFRDYSLLEARLQSGRTHQIRVHLAAVKHPVAGDRTYHGPDIPGLSRQFLHAHRLGLVSPSGGQVLEFTSSLPADLQAVLDRLRSD